MSAFDIGDDGFITRWVDYVGASTRASPPPKPRVVVQLTPPVSHSVRKHAPDEVYERSRCNVVGGCGRELTQIPGRQGCCGPLTDLGYAHSTNVCRIQHVDMLHPNTSPTLQRTHNPRPRERLTRLTHSDHSLLTTTSSHTVCCRIRSRLIQAWDVARGFCPFTRANMKQLPLADGTEDIGEALERLQSVGDVPFRCWPQEVQRRYKALAAQKSRRKRRAEDPQAPPFAPHMPPLAMPGSSRTHPHGVMMNSMNSGMHASYTHSVIPQGSALLGGASSGTMGFSGMPFPMTMTPHPMSQVSGGMSQTMDGGSMPTAMVGVHPSSGFYHGPLGSMSTHGFQSGAHMTVPVNHGGPIVMHHVTQASAHPPPLQHHATTSAHTSGTTYIVQPPRRD